MDRHATFLAIKVMIERGVIVTISDILKYGIPKYKLYKLIKVANRSFDRLLANPEKFTDEQLSRIAEYFDLPLKNIQTLRENQVAELNHEKKKPR